MARNVQSYYQTPSPDNQSDRLNNLSETPPYISADENYDSDDPEVNANYYLGPERMHVSDQTTAQDHSSSAGTTDQHYTRKQHEPAVDYNFPRQDPRPAVDYAYPGREADDCEEITGAMGGTQIW